MPSLETNPSFAKSDYHLSPNPIFKKLQDYSHTHLTRDGDVRLAVRDETEIEIFDLRYETQTMTYELQDQNQTMTSGLQDETETFDL